ncbi:hypothetical protein KI387_014027 [Taxus chinensis]|uniref:Retrotransposon gag domain-containing protein n=1 Tax=Taxus chinensis TaxID=29808 RepID=A0AA38CU04_TAXCH|nr:hypothetical protein KI387_014027 [Taxus chinensis]
MVKQQETTNLYLSQLTERLAQGRIETHAEKGEASNMGQHGNRSESRHSGQGSPHASTRPLGLHKPSFLKDLEVSQTRQPADIVDEESCWEKYRTLSEGFRDNMPFQEYCKMKIGSRPRRDYQPQVPEFQKRLGQISIPHFDGSRKCTAQSWIQKLKTYFDLNPMREEDAIKFAILHLEGDAHDWWHHGLITQGHMHITTYADFTQRLMSRFDRRDPDRHFRESDSLGFRS